MGHPPDAPIVLPRWERQRLPIWSCSVRGFACHPPYGGRGALLPHLFTLTLLRSLKPFGQASYGGQASWACPTKRGARSRAVCFLCHCPSGHPDRSLTGAQPYGVRTFLSRERPRWLVATGLTAVAKATAVRRSFGRGGSFSGGGSLAQRRKTRRDQDRSSRHTAAVVWSDCGGIVKEHRFRPESAPGLNRPRS